MKKINILLVLLLLMSINAFSQTSQPVAYAVLKDNTLTFYYNDKKPEKAYDVEKMVLHKRLYVIKEWTTKHKRIKTVVFDQSFKDYTPKSCGMWFLSCDNLTSIKGINENLNTSEVTDMFGMFSLCENLTSLDVSSFNTDNVTEMSLMFQGCKNLKTIYVGDGWQTSRVTDSEDMFKNCPNLVGEKGTKFNEKHTDVEYAHIDGGESTPGYLTKKTK